MLMTPVTDFGDMISNTVMELQIREEPWSDQEDLNKLLGMVLKIIPTNFTKNSHPDIIHLFSTPLLCYKWWIFLMQEN